MDLFLGERVVEILRISVNCDEVNTLNLTINHMINRIFAGTADSDNLDSGARFYLWFDLWHALILNFRFVYLIIVGGKKKQLTYNIRCSAILWQKLGNPARNNSSPTLSALCNERRISNTQGPLFVISIESDNHQSAGNSP